MLALIIPRNMFVVPTDNYCTYIMLVSDFSIPSSFILVIGINEKKKKQKETREFSRIYKKK